MPHSSSASSGPPSRDRRSSSFQVYGGRRFSVGSESCIETVVNACTTFAETFILMLGPLLVCFASAIITGLAWVFFTIYLPMMRFALDQMHASPLRRYLEIGGNVAFVVFILVEIIFNYVMCVTTRNTGPKSSYDAVVRELAEATNLDYPKTPQEVARFRRDFDDKMILRLRRRQARDAEEQQRDRQNAHSRCCDANGTCSGSNNNSPRSGSSYAPAQNASSSAVAAAAQSRNDEDMLPENGTGGVGSSTNAATGDNITQRKNTKKQKRKKKTESNPPPTAPIRSWMLMAADEWGYCSKTKQPKPPRSHYDHVSKSLVLCLDHYCPWMFNSIGYFNYRYFVNFLGFVFTGMMYGMFISYRPFANSTGPLYRSQLTQFRNTGVWTHIHPYTPINSERMPLSLGFMLCLAVGIAVACLGCLHLYLLLTGQTTIEFHGNLVNRAKAKRLGQKYRNPYDMGLKRNWQQVYGDYNCRWSMLMAVLIPSKREPDFLPLPLRGEEGKRKHLQRPKLEEDDELKKPFIASQATVPAHIV